MRRGADIGRERSSGRPGGGEGAFGCSRWSWWRSWLAGRWGRGWVPVWIGWLVWAGGMAAGADRPTTPAYLRMPPTAPISGNWRPTRAFPRQAPLAYPVGFVPFPGSRLLVYTQGGQIFLIPNDPASEAREEILDLRVRTMGYGDTGLLNVVLHPEFGRPGSPNRGYLYVWYATYEGDFPTSFEYTTWNRLSRFTIPDGGTRVDPGSELILIEQADRHLFHAGGGMFFHPVDGFLYLAVSDEGSENDALNSAQQVERGLFSGVLRIDVDQRGGEVSHPIRRQPVWGRTQHYFIPNDNPWVGEDGVLEEFWAIGLRNPHRMTFDAVGGRAWIGDVGQLHREEIDVLERGANYGWPFREGDWAGPRERPAKPRGHEVEPVWGYGRDAGFCIIGGFVYRGERYRDSLGGKYVFADLGGVIRAATLNAAGNAVVAVGELGYLSAPWDVASLGEDESGEILITGIASGTFWRLEFDPGESGTLPPRLSETGIFQDVTRLEPAPGVVPYAVNSPLWSDGAEKRRWLAVPYDPERPEGRTGIRFAADGPWEFPPGTVAVKHFEIRTNELDPLSLRRLETRVLVKTGAGGVYGVTYRWRPGSSDADLQVVAAREELVIQTASGERRQTWTYPGMFDCLTCHTKAAGQVLGISTAQLNCPGPAVAGSNGQPANQLEDWAARGILEGGPGPGEAAALPRLVSPADEGSPMHERVRSYLEANCAHCHRPGGVRAGFDARYSTPLPQQGLVGGAAADDLGQPGMKLVAPRHPELSAVYQRLIRNDAQRMPLLGRDRVDPLAADLFRRWIEGFPRIQLAGAVTNAETESDPLRLAVSVEMGHAVVRRIRYLRDGEPVAESAGVPYGAEVADAGLGEHVFQAVLEEESGLSFTSEPVRTFLYPRRLTMGTASSDGHGWVVQVYGPVGRNFLVERSRDLVIWEPVDDATLARLYYRPMAEMTDFDSMFYRARVKESVPVEPTPVDPKPVDPAPVDPNPPPVGPDPGGGGGPGEEGEDPFPRVPLPCPECQEP